MLLVARLADVAGPSRDLVALLDWLDACDGELIALDVGLDTAPCAGTDVVRVLREIERWERGPPAGRLPRRRPWARSSLLRAGRPHHDVSVMLAKPPSHRQSAQRRGHADAARREPLATVKRAERTWLTPPTPASARSASPAGTPRAASKARALPAGEGAASARETPTPRTASVTEVIEQFGALGVFLLMVPESACIPIPSEVTLLFSGFAVH